MADPGGPPKCVFLTVGEIETGRHTAEKNCSFLPFVDSTRKQELQLCGAGTPSLPRLLGAPAPTDPFLAVKRKRLQFVFNTKTKGLV